MVRVALLWEEREEWCVPGHVELVVSLVSAGLDARHLFFGEGRQRDGLDAVRKLAVDAAAGRAHEGVVVRDDVLGQLQTSAQSTARIVGVDGDKHGVVL